MKKQNIDIQTVNSFGYEWTRYDQKTLTDEEANKIFNDFFYIFPWESLPKNSVGFDMGCGSGRWAKLLAPRVGHLYCIDPSTALEVAKINLSSLKNISFLKESVDDCSLKPNSLDFGYSLGVLHHVPDTAAAISACVSKLKKDAPFLLYLYYDLDNRPKAFKIAWKVSNYIRKIVSKIPERFKHVVTDTFALLIYYPLAKISKILELMNFNIKNVPLSYYRNHSFFTMKTDARDRFGTPLEQRFNQEQIKIMMELAGLHKIKFSEKIPFWCAVGFKK